MEFNILIIISVLLIQLTMLQALIQLRLQELLLQL